MTTVNGKTTACTIEIMVDTKKATAGRHIAAVTEPPLADNKVNIGGKSNKVCLLIAVTLRTQAEKHSITIDKMGTNALIYVIKCIISAEVFSLTLLLTVDSKPDVNEIDMIQANAGNNDCTLSRKICSKFCVSSL